MSKLNRKKLLLAKIETTYGTDATPTGIMAIQANDLNLTPLENDEEENRLIRPYFGGYDKYISGGRSKLDIELPIAGSGTKGAAPNFDVLLRACGLAAVITAGTSVEYTPITDGAESATLYFYLDGLLHKLTGARGTLDMSMLANKVPKLKFSFTGIYNPVTDTVMPAATFTAASKPVLVSTDNTTIQIHGQSAPTESIEFSLANQVIYEELIGSKSVDITDRAPAGNVVIEMTSVAQKDWFNTAISAQSGVVTLTHGKTAGNIVELSSPKVSFNAPSYQDKNGKLMLKLGMAFLPSAGNDDFKLTFK